MKYTREKLIEICEKAFVPQLRWNNRDSASSQLGIGKCYTLLKAGCYFEIITKENQIGVCVTDDETIWIQFWVHDFLYFEYGSDFFDKDGHKDSDYYFYLPTEKRLKRVKGNDWY